MSGKTDDIKGKGKEAVGDLTDHKGLQREGKADQATGAVKKKGRRGQELGRGQSHGTLTSVPR